MSSIRWKTAPRAGSQFRNEARSRCELMLVTSAGPGIDRYGAALAISLSAAKAGRPVLLVEPRAGRRRPAGMFSTEMSRGISAVVKGRYPDLEPVGRGPVCHLTLPSDGSPDVVIDELCRTVPDRTLCVAVVGHDRFRQMIDEGGVEPTSVLLAAELPRDRAIAALVHEELSRRGIGCQIWKRRSARPGPMLAAAGFAPAGETGRYARRLLARVGSARGQATVALLGAICVLAVVAGVLVAFGGALTGKARAQRAADLAALSGARSLRDDLPRRLSPPTVNGVPNPYHLSRAHYLARARAAALRGGLANGAGPARIRVRFPDRLSPAPLRVEVRILARWSPGEGDHSGPASRGRATDRVEVKAVAAAEFALPGLTAAGASASASGAGTVATGGGYSGPLAIRQGKGMRPDVAAAFDLMSAAAAGAGHRLTVNSAFRSDAEQARLFAANPDPRWVARPGTSLHRCATELDLGPPSAYGWLAANAQRFGFTQRYSWEAWHFGFVRGPAPCVASPEGGRHGVAPNGRSAARGRGDGRLTGAGGLPAFVPAAIVPLIERAAARWDVSAALLAAQLQAESNFDPNVVSSAGAQGIAQFMPGTAAAYGLTDPFDPARAIMAQAHLMSDLLRRFGGAAELALAAYNAGPGAVSPCNCVPDYPETRAYVQKIMALVGGAVLGGSGTATAPLQIRLIH